MSRDQADVDSPFARGVSGEVGGAPEFAPVWARKVDLPKFAPVSGLTMQAMTGGKLMLNWVTIEPNAAVPLHQHPHEQAGAVLEGMLELTIGGESRQLRPGDAYVIPPNVVHGAVTYDEGCLVLDIFTPPREDYVRR